MKNLLKQYAQSLNIEYIGIASAGPYKELEDIWKKRLDAGYITGFEESEFSRRIDPRLTLPNAMSVIVCLFPYFIGSNKDANLSKSCFSIDYHIIAKKKLEQIGQFLADKIPGFEYKAFVDNGPLVDRYLAYLAGLGYFGINSHIITDKYGSYVFIGYIINSYPFKADKPLDKTCTQCGRCIRSCPGNAILGDFNINPLTCKSYLTQKKGELSTEEISILKKSKLVYGCDICQDICLHNMNVAHTPIKEFRENIISSLDYEELKNISNKEFIKKYKDRAFSWRGKSILVRNFELIENRL